MTLPDHAHHSSRAQRVIEAVEESQLPRLTSRAWFITGTYALFATLWILFSDLALGTVARDEEQFIALSLYKGFAFVAATSLLLLLLLRRAFGAVQRGYLAERASSAIVSGQNAVLSSIAAGAPLGESLTHLVEFIESRSPDTRCSVRLLNKAGTHLRHGASRRLPAEYTQAIDGSAIGPLAGSCGTAALLREAVFVSDISTDERWTDHRHLALSHGLRACWSTPIFDAQSRVLGTFAMYFADVGKPTAHHRRLIDVATQLAAVAIERDRSISALAESESRFHAFMDASPAIAWVKDADGRHVYTNRGWNNAFSVEQDQWLGRTAADLIQPGEAARIEQSDAEILATNQPVEIKEDTVDVHGKSMVWHIHKFPFANASGERFVGGFAIDVTRRKQAEAALRAVEEQMQLVVENLLEGLVIADPDGSFLYWNPAALRILGFADAATGRANQDSFNELFSLATLDGTPLPPHEWPLARVRRGEALQEFEVQVRRVGTEWQRTLSYTGAMVEYANARRLVFLTIADITDRKNAERKLREVNERLESKVQERTAELRTALVRAEAADRLKSAFLATMSHELRTPLNSIIGFTGIVLQGMAGPVNEEQSRQLGMVRGSARHLLALINDVLDLSKIEAGQLEMRAEPFDLRALVERVVATVQPMAENKSLKLELSIEPTLRHMVSDPRRVEQILLNIASNAVKFTVQGSVHIHAQEVQYTPSHTSHGNGNGHVRGAKPDTVPAVRIAVTDTGIGIRKEDQASLFLPFRQIDTGLSRQHEGTGLGLSICRRLSELLGGEISVHSEWSKGSTFVVTLPLIRQP